MNVYFAGWFRSPFVMWHMKHPTDDENVLKCFWLVVLHGIKLTRKDLLPGTSLQKTGCVLLSSIAHPFLGPQCSDLCSYFEFYLNGSIKLIKIHMNLLKLEFSHFSLSVQISLLIGDDIHCPNCLVLQGSNNSWCPNVSLLQQG